MIISEEEDEEGDEEVTEQNQLVSKFRLGDSISVMK